MSTKSLPVLLALSRALHGVESIEEALGSVREVLRERTRYRWTYVHLLHPDGKTLEIAGWVLPNADFIRVSTARVDVSRDPFLNRVLQAVDPLVLEDLRLIPDADQVQVQAAGLRTCIVLPMFEGDDRIGPLVIATFADQGALLPTEEEMDLFVQIASLLAVVIGRMRAVAQRLAAEQKLARAARQEAMGRMAGEVAHDFNNLLLAIIANLDLAQAELGAHPVASYLEDANAAAQRAARLTRMLLASSKGQVIAQEPVDLCQVLRVAESVVDKVLSADVQLEVSTQLDAAMVLGDRDQLERVVTNLLLNARDAITGPGRILVELHSVHINGEYVAAQRELGSGDYAVLSVSDDGAGMSAEVQACIFEPFFSTKPSERGTGLGLSVVLGVVQQHAGDVHVYSEPGLGTTFKIYLPLDSGAIATTPVEPAEIGDLEGSESILVVDDDEHVRRTVQRILTQRGYHVEVAADPDGARKALEAQSFDILLSDVVLGAGSGIVLADEARQAHPDMKVLLMTGYSPVAIRAGIGPNLVKPFSARELLIAVRRALVTTSSPLVRG